VKALRTQEEKRYRRLQAKARKQDARCTLCGGAVHFGRSGLWIDPLSPERPGLYFVLCYTCETSNHTDALNRLHRQVWDRQHGHNGTRQPDKPSIYR